ncbi:MAG: hypothetical protein WAW79_06950, partial [Steroidobacteraceae bacterium]
MRFGPIGALLLIGGCFQAEAPPVVQASRAAVSASPAATQPKADAGRARELAVMEIADEAGGQAVPILASVALNDP